MPYSLQWTAGLLVCAILAATASLSVQRLQSEMQGRAQASALTDGDPRAGRAAIDRFGCGGCHQIEGVLAAQGRVGPSLKGIAKQAELAGRLTNDPAHMVRWIRDPQSVQPGGGMPNLSVSEKDGRDIAAYLYAER